MAKGIHKLNSKQIAAFKEPGRYSDGGGLYLKIFKGGSRSWVMMWVRNGKRREMGLGSTLSVSLKDARTKAENVRKQIENGLDPIIERKREDEPTFLDCALKYIEAHENQWKNEKHRYQWRHTLTVYAKPLHRHKVSQITTPDILTVLKPIWLEKHETATRLRSRIEAVLDYATAMHWREGMNPAIWRGNLKSLLPSISKSKRVVHHKAMEIDDLPAFIAALKEREAIAARLIEFVILTACRSIEAREAKWDEFDFEAKTWTLSKDRMKAGRPHIVALSDRALEIVTSLYETRQCDYVFPHANTLKPLSDNAPRALMKRMKIDVTLHGFRATFKSWATDRTNFQREIIEMALAHKVGNEVEASYLRTSALDKRRKLMQNWADYCADVKVGEVVQLHG